MELRRQALINIFWQIFSCVMVFVLNITLMELIVNRFDLAINGFIRVNLTLITLIAGVESGIGVATSIFLYKPLQEKNWAYVNHILTTTHKQNKFLAKLGLVILVLIVVGYGLYVYFDSQQVIRSNNSSMKLEFWWVALIIFFIVSRNIVHMLATGAVQNLIKADNRNAILILLDILANCVVYGAVFALFLIAAPIWVLFAPFLLYSPVMIAFVKLHAKRNYAWLKIAKKPQHLNRFLIKSSIPIAIQKAGYGILLNSDLVIIAILLGFTVGSTLAFYLTIAIFLRSIMLVIVLSFQNFYGLLFASQGRLHWKKYRKIEFLTYGLAAVAFINQFISSPYLVNSLFDNVLTQNINNFSNRSLYITIFNEPTFSLVLALSSVLVIITEPINIFIYSKNKYREVANKYLGFSILYIVLAAILGISLAATNNPIPALYSVLILKIAIQLALYVYVWLFNFLMLTYNSRFMSFFPNLMVLIGPIAIAICLMYFVIYPDNNLTYQVINNVSYHSAVSEWSILKLTIFLLAVLGVSFTLPGIFMVGYQVLVHRTALIQGVKQRLLKNPRRWTSRIFIRNKLHQEMISFEN